MKKIALLGSTGSIGCNALRVARDRGGQHMQIVALAAYQNIDLLQQQIEEFHPEYVVVYDQERASILQGRIKGQCRVLSGMDGLCAIAALPEVDLVLAAMSGAAGLEPTAAAIKAKKCVALANKEVLVAGGEWISQLAKDHGVHILPIDSEHSALFQCLQGENISSVQRLILTASGGPFFSYSQDMLKQVDVEQALRHPNWSMGEKITIDSSTLMNKGLEVIEAHYLFHVPINKIEVVIHPQSIIHSMVEFCDTSIKAQMGYPSMTCPIQYAMTYPDRQFCKQQPFDFTKAHSLQFFPPDVKKFPCLQLAFDAAKAGKSAPCYLSAANEVLVKRFLKKEIAWIEIGQLLHQLLERHALMPAQDLQSIQYIDKSARRDAQNIR